MNWKLIKIKFTFTDKKSGKERYGFNFYLTNDDESLVIPIAPKLVKKNDKVVYSSEDLLRSLAKISTKKED